MGFVYKSPTMDFKRAGMVRFGSREADEVGEILAAQDANQGSLLSVVLDQKYFH
jgi:hypothetical protein